MRTADESIGNAHYEVYEVLQDEVSAEITQVLQKKDVTLVVAYVSSSSHDSPLHQWYLYTYGSHVSFKLMKLF